MTDTLRSRSAPACPRCAKNERLLRQAMAGLREVTRALPHLVLAEIEKQLDDAPDRPVVGGDDSVWHSIGGILGVGQVEP